jgi:hypothetical protein
MKRALPVTIIGLFFAVEAGAADTPATSTGPAARAELIALDDAWVKAEVGGDRQGLERILDERFLATFASGRTIGQGAYIDFIVGEDIAPFKVVHDKIVVHGDTAVVIDLSESGRTKFTWIAVRREGHWKVISETFSRMTSQ